MLFKVAVLVSSLFAVINLSYVLRLLFSALKAEVLIPVTMAGVLFLKDSPGAVLIPTNLKFELLKL